MIVTFITTVEHNVGDDFVREGIKYLLRQVLYGKEIIFQNIHKHSPITARHGFEWFKNLRISKFNFPSQKLDKLLPLQLTKDKILEADLVVQSGAPVYWCHKEFGSHCADNEWYDVLIRRRLMKKTKVKLLNVAAGSCQEFKSDGSEFKECPRDMDYIKEFYSASSLTTVRDKLAQNVLASAGLSSELIPCPSIFAIDEYGLKPGEKKYLIMNYMNIGGHYTFGKKIERSRWLKELKSFYDYIKNKEEVLFVCHNKKELSDAQLIDPEAKTFYSDNFLDYMKIYANAKYGIMNRVHGAFLMASYGAPSFVIGNDSRATMTNEIGLESMFINDVDLQILLNKYEALKKAGSTFKTKFDSIKKDAYDRYFSVFSGILKS
ncbi:MAG: polysaccharide pyruvyl transferase family protein [Ignavibacteria bacterium]